jgi:cell division protein FtsX
LTDRIQSLTVVLEEDLRDDDAREIADAIAKLRGVQLVTLGEPVDMNVHVERQRLRRSLGASIVSLLSGEKPVA